MALLLGMAMLPAGGIAMQVGLNAVSARQSAYEETLGRRALQSIDLERGIIDQVRELVRVLATSPALQQARSGNCREWFTSVMVEYPDVASISVGSDDGHVLCSVPAAPRNFAVRPSELRRLARDRDNLAMGYVPFSQLTRTPVLGAVTPLHDDSDRRVGFIGVSIKVERLRQILDRGHDANGARSAIVDANGRILATSSVTPGAWAPRLPSTSEVRQHFGPNPSFIDAADGAAIVAPLSPPDLYLVMAWSPDRPAWLRAAGYAASVAAPLLIWILAVAAGWFAIEIYVARPLSALEASARGFARGEEEKESDALTNAPVEIRSLRRTMAAMAKTLRGREMRLIEALAEERALLREVHHRVKNNLQMVASLLSIQARAAHDEAESRGLARAQDRVQLLALVHQRIYASGEVREVRLDDMMAELTRQLVQARGPAAQKLVLKLDLGCARADADRAVPLAFLIGEGVSTALDALGDAPGVELHLSLAQDEDGTLRIAIDANAAESVVAEPTSSSRLIDAFARQLGAQLGRNLERPFMLWICVPPAKT